MRIEDDLTDSLEKRSARERALKILGSRNMSKCALEKRLVQKGESVEDAQEAVEWLEELRLIDDEEHAAAIVRHYSGKGYGAAKIKDELYRRGIPREMWDEALGQLGDMDDAALEFLQKKLKGGSDKTELRRAMDALSRRGFSYEEARRAMSRYIEMIEETTGEDDE
ncbi:MAG: recombination regulator RecX [Oscillospiraceae bacterium]|nr:recombination regulator RecX [Oscillospiraceae bacterium]